jgi:hypothetical protein
LPVGTSSTQEAEHTTGPLTSRRSTMHGSTTGITEISVPVPPPSHTRRITAHVPEVPQKLNLAQGTLAEHGMVERRDALDGDLVPEAMCTAEL